MSRDLPCLRGPLLQGVGDELLRLGRRTPWVTEAGRCLPLPFFVRTHDCGSIPPRSCLWMGIRSRVWWGSIDRVALAPGLRLHQSDTCSSGEVTRMSTLRGEREYNRDDRWGAFHVKRAVTRRQVHRHRTHVRGRDAMRSHAVEGRPGFMLGERAATARVHVSRETLLFAGRDHLAPFRLSVSAATRTWIGVGVGRSLGIGLGLGIGIGVGVGVGVGVEYGAPAWQGVW